MFQSVSSCHGPVQQRTTEANFTQGELLPNALSATSTCFGQQLKPSFQRSFDQITRSPPPPQREPAWTASFQHSPPTCAPSSSSTSGQTRQRQYPLFRFPGDGVDCRQPVMSRATPGNAVIDLTVEPDSPPLIRLPPQPPNNRSTPEERSQQEVIDLEATSRGQTSNFHPPGRSGRDSDDDVVFVRSSFAPQVQGVSAYNQLTDATRRAENAFTMASRGLSLDQQNRLFQRRHQAHLAQQQAAQQAQRDWQRPRQHPPDYFGTIAPPQGRRRWQVPGLHHVFGLLPNLGGLLHGVRLPAPNLDYETAGFQVTDQAPAIPTYKEPPPALPGFTRSPTEDVVLVCPNCDDELGIGAEPQKREVWAVRECGHVCCRKECLAMSFC